MSDFLGYAPHECPPEAARRPEPAPLPVALPKKRTRQGAKRTTVVRTRNGGTMTEAMFWGMLRSGLRRIFRFWVPIRTVLLNARRSYNGPKKQQKWEFLCAHCGQWFPRKCVEVDHTIPCGSLRSWEDVAPFIQRLAVEDISLLQVLCLECHDKKTESDKSRTHESDSRASTPIPTSLGHRPTACACSGARGSSPEAGHHP